MGKWKGGQKVLKNGFIIDLLQLLKKISFYCLRVRDVSSSFNMPVSFGEGPQVMIVSVAEGYMSNPQRVEVGGLERIFRLKQIIAVVLYFYVTDKHFFYYISVLPV